MAPAEACDVDRRKGQRVETPKSPAAGIRPSRQRARRATPARKRLSRVALQSTTSGRPRPSLTISSPNYERLFNGARCQRRHVLHHATRMSS